MTTAQAILYLVAVILLVVAAFGVPARVSLALLALPAIAGGFH